MRLTRFFAAFCTAMIVFSSLPVHVSAQPLIPLRSAWLGEHETFIVWYAKEKGWDKQEGLDLTLLPFETGKDIVNGMESTGWAVAGVGAMPALTASLDNKLYVVGIGNDESAANALYVRPDSPILAQRGHNLQFPDVFGSPESVRGKTILCARGTSAHYLLTRWLNVLGLTEKDVAVRDMTPEQALTAFASGVGDAVALWAPLTYAAEREGLRTVALSSQCNGRQPILLVANYAYANKHPEHITAFLRVFLRGVDMLRSTPHTELVKDYQNFYKSWTGRELTHDEVLRDLASHPVFTLSEQLAAFAPVGEVAPSHTSPLMIGSAPTPKNSRLLTWLNGIVDFHSNVGDLSRREVSRLENFNLVTDVYLKKVQATSK